MTTSRYALLLLLPLAGCASTEKAAWEMQNRQPKPAPLVDVSGQGAVLGQSAMGPQQFLDRVGADLMRRREAEARARIARYPELAHAVLSAHVLMPVPTRPSPALTFIARVHGQQGGGPWERLLAERLREPDAFVSFAGEHASARSAPADEEVELTVPASVRRDLLLDLEADRVKGDHARRAGERERAVRLYEEGLRKARQQARYQAAGFALRLAELNLGDQQAAAVAWTRAAELGLAVLDGPEVATDAEWWTQLLDLRQELSRWPEGARGVLAQHAWPDAVGKGLKAESPSAMAWVAVGRWRAARKEPRAALLALRKAQEETRTPWTRGQIELLQARALLALEQPSAASAVLMGLADHKEPDIAQAATALLGTLRLRNGQLRRGFGLLRQAVEEGTTAEWAFQAEAEADLGLAYLAMGNQERGLHYLHVAQRRFQRDGDMPGLRRCLKNELRYLDHQEEEELAEEVRQRCLRLGVEQ